MLAESLVLAIAGAGIGLALAWSLLGVIKSLAPQRAARFQGVAIDGGVLLFTVAVTLLTSLFAGVTPVWARLNGLISASGLSEEAGRGGTAGFEWKHRAQSWLVGGQVALSLWSY